jgi:chromosome segregation ATPase
LIFFRLENKLEDVKSQCNAHAERARAVTAERNRLENQRVQAEEELLALNEEILFLRNQLQVSPLALATFAFNGA